MRYAIVRNGIVENLTEWDGNAETWHPPEGAKAEAFPEGAVSIGWTWNDGTPVDPNPPAAPKPQPALTHKQKVETVLGITIPELKTLIAGK